VVGNYKEIFDIEMHCWCLGLSKTKEKLDCNVLHRVIKEFSPIIKEAIENLYVFDIVDTAKKFITASRCKASEQEISFHILSLLPNPQTISEEQQEIFFEIVNNLEKKYPGALGRIEKKWHLLPKIESHKLENDFSFDSLSLPKMR